MGWVYLELRRLAAIASIFFVAIASSCSPGFRTPAVIVPYVDTSLKSATSLTWVEAPALQTTSVNAIWTRDVSIRLTSQSMQIFSDATCSTPLGSSITFDSSRQTYPFVLPGVGTYTYKITSYSSADNKFQESACSSSLTVDTTPPNPATSAHWVEASPHGGTRTVTAAWTRSTSNDIKNQQLQFYSDGSCGTPSGSSVDLNSATESSYGWTAPVNGTYTYQVTSVDLAGNATLSGCSTAMVINVVVPATPTVVITDANTSSTVHTNHATNTIAITGDTGAVKWCVIEQPAASAAPSAPLATDSCFVGVRPTSITLSNRGALKIYVFTQDGVGTLSATYGMANFDFPLPTVLAYAGPSSIPQHGCSDAMQITALDSYGLTSPAPSPTTVALSGGSSFYTDAGCTSSTATTSIGTGGSVTPKFYYKSSALGAFTLQGVAFGATATLSTSVDAVYLLAGKDQTLYQVIAGEAQIWGEIGSPGAIDFEYSGSPVVKNGLTAKVTSIASFGRGNGCAVEDGAVKCWGENWSSRLGTGDAATYWSPQQVYGLTSGARKVVTSWSGACAIVGEAAKCWGESQILGNGGVVESNIPVQVTGLTNGVTDISAASDYVCAVQNGAAKCWGLANDEGKLGDGTDNPSLTPVSVVGLTTGVTKVSAGSGTTCAIQNGAAYCWGSGDYSKLANGSSADSYTPVAITGLGSNVTDIVANSDSVCAIKSGVPYCWGRNQYGQSGGAVLDYTEVTTPTAISGITTAKSLMNNQSGTICAVLTDNTIRCWGNGAHGEWGTGEGAPINVPVTIGTYTGTATGVSVFDEGICILNSAGRVQCWGNGTMGQIGDNEYYLSRFTPTFASSIPSGATAIRSGDDGVCAIVNGGAMCWGGNEYGKLGLGTFNWAYGTPTSVVGATTSVSDIQISQHRSCFVVDGGLKCTGRGEAGVLGDGDATDHNLSTVVSSTYFPAGSGVTKVSIGESSTCVLLSTGTIKCMGYGWYGQLGDGSGLDSAAPVTAVASGATDISGSAQGGFHCAVVGGAAQCWGVNWYGTMGDGSLGDHASPSTVSSLSTGVSKIVTGEQHACALMTAGTVKCWGRNHRGQLGEGTTISEFSSLPVDVVGITNATAIAAANNSTCALLADNAVKCWGSNYHNILKADGSSLYSTSLFTPVRAGVGAKLSLSGPATSTSGSCSGAITVTLKTSAGATVSASANTTVTLSNGGTGAYYADPTCSSGTVNTVQINSGASSAQFYYKAGSAQGIGIVARGSNLAPATMKHTAN